MNKLVPFTVADMAKVTNYRNGEIKFGEKMLTAPKDVPLETVLQTTEAKFVIIGIPEDIGVRANSGKAGAATLWDNAIKGIANIQHNRFCKGSQLLVLGKIDVSEEMKAVENLDFNSIEDRTKLSKLVSQIDKEVCHLVCTIIKAGKTPLIIGGGHNNSYGNIKGSALAKGKPINAINFDSQSDFRILEGRHSGNGFSYAYEEGFLKNYFIFGLHENYISKNVLDLIKKTENRVRFNTYDSLKIRKDKNFDLEMIEALNFIKNDYFGMEIDLDALPIYALNTNTLSGFSVEEVRKFIYFFAQNNKATYLHICQGTANALDEKNDFVIGKLIGYMITDFLKAKNNVLPLL